MAYPPKVPWGTAPIRELVQDYGGTGLAHNRLHLGNIIFSHVADESEYDLEHGLVPLVKVCCDKIKVARGIIVLTR